MTIEWNNFQNTLKNYFANYLAESEEQAATFITDLYATNVLAGGDLSYKNMAIKFNKNLLETALKNSFKIAKNGNTTSHIPQMISQGLIGFWSGAELAKTIPPPGSIAIVTNFVNNPGTPQNLQIFNNQKVELFAKSLMLMFKLHLMTIAGVTTALVPQPSGPPIPVPFSWTGYA